MTNEDRLAHYRRHLADPVFTAAIATHGTTAARAERSPAVDAPPEVILGPRDGLPYISIAWGFAMVRWGEGGQNRLQYETSPDGIIHVTTTDVFPDVLLTAMPGRPLRDLVTIDGDPGYVVMDARQRELGDFRDTVLTIELVS